MKKSILRAASALLVLAMCAMLAACSGKKLGMKQVVGVPLSTAVTQLGTITGKPLTYYSQGKFDDDGKTYSPSDDSQIELLSGEFACVDIVESYGEVDSVTFFGAYERSYEYMNVLDTLKDYYGDDFTKSDNNDYDTWVWKDTPDGKVVFSIADSIFWLKYSA